MTTRAPKRVLKRLISSLRGARAPEHNAEGVRLLQANRVAEAVRCFERAIAADPGYADATNNLGAALLRLGRGEEAVGHFRRAIELDPDNGETRANLGEALTLAGAPEDAVAALDEALRRDASNSHAHAALLRPLLELCAWPELEREVRLLVKAWERDPGGGWLRYFRPLTALQLPLPPALQREIAVRNARAVTSRARAIPRLAAATPRLARGERLRVGYVSADFRDHPVGQLVAGLLERHDRSRFEIFGYSCGRDDGSSCRNRIAAACDRFADVLGEPFHATAQRIARDGIHVLVDLMGPTSKSRPEIFALRPAPVQLGWLGYPGTTGASEIDYIVADPVVLPEPDFEWYTERVAWLPNSYLPYDDRQPIAERPPTRPECGLPEHGAVFCAFNQVAKIDAEVFAVWMRVLQATAGSVLWLSAANAGAVGNLRAAAARDGVDPARLVIAPRVAAKADHLARHRVADLFLDTHRYNAHTTACDALWAGLPLVTCPGTRFPARVAASLLRAVGLPELIAASLEEYERLAIELVHAPAKLAGLRMRLDAARRTAPLFDTARFARDLERAYTIMWDRHAAGMPPRPLAVGDEVDAVAAVPSVLP